ncbi:MAG: ACT domain-containing protein [Anaerolineae bacterium]|nr:ACT domain-containing protein [Anaerolineae bacterium]
MPQTTEQALKQAVLYTDEVDYAFIKLPPKAITAAAGIIAEIGEAFCSLIADKDEVSLVIPFEAIADFEKRLPGKTLSPTPYRLITFDLELDAALVGFMARISTTLAQANVSIIPFGAFSRDHLLVRRDQVEVALAALRRLQSEP